MKCYSGEGNNVALGISSLLLYQKPQKKRALEGGVTVRQGNQGQIDIF